MNGIAQVLKRTIRGLLGQPEQRTAEQRFFDALADLTKDDVVLDCGANVGKFTVPLAQSGAQVHAFEPDPVAYDLLASAVAQWPNVTVHNTAVSNVAGKSRLFLHQQRDEDPVFMSTGSSLLSSKTNVDPQNFVEVELVRLSEFILQFNRVALMKMDIEGHEIEVLNDLIDTDAISRVQRSFVELHDRKNPHLLEATRRLRKRIEQKGINADLSWH
jgi:FkbM family methyltransferase